MAAQSPDRHRDAANVTMRAKAAVVIWSKGDWPDRSSQAAGPHLPGDGDVARITEK